jgi:hypothetical protein
LRSKAPGGQGPICEGGGIVRRCSNDADDDRPGQSFQGGRRQGVRSNASNVASRGPTSASTIYEYVWYYDAISVGSHCTNGASDHVASNNGATDRIASDDYNADAISSQLRAEPTCSGAACEGEGIMGRASLRSRYGGAYRRAD